MASLGWLQESGIFRSEEERMESYQERVLSELKELNERITKLKAFLSTDTFRCLPIEDQQLMYLQFHAMTEYGDILNRRIKRFGKTPEKFTIIQLV